MVIGGLPGSMRPWAPFPEQQKGKREGYKDKLKHCVCVTGDLTAVQITLVPTQCLQFICFHQDLVMVHRM